MQSRIEKAVAKRPVRRTKSTKKNDVEIASLCVMAALDKKAENLIALNVAKLTSFTDIVVICSAPSERQVQAICKEVQTVLKKHGETPIGAEGLKEGNWALLDYVNVIFHCFAGETRSHYDLESLWPGAEKLDLIVEKPVKKTRAVKPKND